jgi:hypothetical protein
VLCELMWTRLLVVRQLLRPVVLKASGPDKSHGHFQRVGLLERERAHLLWFHNAAVCTFRAILERQM